MGGSGSAPVCEAAEAWKRLLPPRLGCAELDGDGVDGAPLCGSRPRERMRSSRSRERRRVGSRFFFSAPMESGLSTDSLLLRRELLSPLLRFERSPRCEMRPADSRDDVFGAASFSSRRSILLACEVLRPGTGLCSGRSVSMSLVPDSFLARGDPWPNISAGLV